MRPNVRIGAKCSRAARLCAKFIGVANMLPRQLKSMRKVASALAPTFQRQPHRRRRSLHIAEQRPHLIAIGDVIGQHTVGGVEDVRHADVEPARHHGNVAPSKHAVGGRHRHTAIVAAFARRHEVPPAAVLVVVVREVDAAAGSWRIPTAPDPATASGDTGETLDGCCRRHAPRMGDKLPHRRVAKDTSPASTATAPPPSTAYTQPLGAAHAVGAHGGGCIAMRRSRSGRFAAAGAAWFARAEGERRHGRPANSQPRAARRRP